MTEQDKLREAIKDLRDGLAGRTAGVCRTFYPDALADVLLVCDAAESTLPKTKMVEVWRVDYAFRQSRNHEWEPRVQNFTEKASADHYVMCAGGNDNLRFARVTGPHMQEVPA